MEKQNFTNNSIRKDILDKVEGVYNGKKFNFNLINADCRLQKNNGKYYLFVPELLVIEKHKSKNKQITIDPGVRKFGTCITENKVIKIGENCGDKIEKYLLRKDNIMSNKYISEKIKEKNEKLINRKVKNLINELHWKTIDYVTKNYETILIGNMSSKDIVSNNKNLNKMTKRILLHLNFHTFRQRLKFKCDIKNKNYGNINEMFTSKMCSLCGNIDENLKSSKIYNCKKCKTIMDRDVNGARNIHIKSIK